ncbi:type I-B CRISPR-associated protein Cas8b1/Cst1 [Hazenella coriacea]|uniref:type I-B CRISPR-associated protein Cas8b1/Cst1 n=1 Tax=Hazenella coriacea TaxID=1179467 RepID=UPI0010465F06|nr:type I-B CRISPR-associated protein Cas8b1/Cst1 [Hazenella coriacea]
MNKRIYLDEWFINAGVLGFLTVLQRSASPSQYQVGQHYIEFDPAVLDSFAVHFFDILIEKFSKYEQDRLRFQKQLEFAKREDYLKANKDQIAKTIKSTRDKLKKAKIDKATIDQIEDLLGQLKTIKTYQDYEALEAVTHSYLMVLEDTNINNVLTINYIRSVLSALFGQPSFLNPSFQGTKEQFIEKFHDDYIKPVIAECKLMDWVRTVPTDQLEVELKKKKKEKETQGHLKKLVNEAIKQTQSIERILPCSVQPDFPSSIQFEEKMFFPLGLSLENQNMAWDGRSTILISNMTRFLLFCSSISFTYYLKRESHFGSTEYTPTFGFVNLYTSIKHLVAENKVFENKRNESNPFQELIYDLLLKTTEDLSIYTLQNILFLEFSVEKKNSKLHYFHIPKKLALFFKEDASDLKRMKNKSMQHLFVEEVLKRRDTIYFIEKSLRNLISDKHQAQVVFWAILARHKLEHRLRGESTLSDKKLTKLFFEGKELAALFHLQQKDNQLQGISYRLLNACKAGNKQLFFDTLLRVYMTSNRIVPSLFLNILHEKDLDFVEVGYSFISGLQAKPEGGDRYE